MVKKDQQLAGHIQHGLKENNLIFRTDANLAVKTNIVTVITNNGGLLGRIRYSITLKVHMRYLKYWSYHGLLHVSAAEEGEKLENQYYFGIFVS